MDEGKSREKNRSGEQKIRGTGSQRRRIDVKHVHVTLHKVKNSSKDYWLAKAREFRSNVVACLVGVEENYDEGKGVHVHIMLQFSTRQKLSRAQFVKYFGTDCLHIATKKDKSALLIGLGYISKTGNVVQGGTFTYRGLELDVDPEVHRFNYQTRTTMDAVAYFQKVIKESIDDPRDVITRLSKEQNDIGRYLLTHPSLKRSLLELEHAWKFSHRNSRKLGFTVLPFVFDKCLLKDRYVDYLRRYPSIFEKWLPKGTSYHLEKDFDSHVEHELYVIRTVANTLVDAIKYKWARPHKSLNLYIWSRKPSFGKTRLMNFLCDNLVAYRLPDDQYYTDYLNLSYQVLISDEAARFLQTKGYAHLKTILEGQTSELNRKHRSKVIKDDNPLMVLADNRSFDELMKRYFKDDYDKDVMASRVLDIELKSRATLHFFLDSCVEPNVEDKSKDSSDDSSGGSSGSNDDKDDSHGKKVNESKEDKS